MNKKLSVIIPVYNGSQGIKQCLESIFRQQCENLEVIIIDDGSTDDSVEKIKHVLQVNHNPQITTKLICHKNQGVAITRNYGIKISTGDYIGFVDQDDIVSPEHFQNYIQKAEETNADIVIGGYRRVLSDGTQKRKVQLQGYEWEKFVVLSPWAHIYKRKFIVDNNIKFLSESIGEDVYFNLLAYSYTDKIDIISDVGYGWIYNPKSVSNSKQNTINQQVNPVHLLNSIVKDIQNQEFLHDKLTEYYFARYVCWYMLFASRGSKKSDIEAMLKSLLSWLQKNYPEYIHNRYVRFRRPKGEPISISASVWGFYLLQRMGLLSHVIKIFGVS